MKKNLFLFLLILTLIVGNMPIGMSVYADQILVNDDIELNYSVAESKIYKGDIFSLSIDYTDINNMGIDEISIKVPTNNSFTPISSDNQTFAENDSTTFSIKYLGGTDKIPVTVTYEKSGSSTITKVINLTIQELDNTDTNSGGTSDPSKYEPKLVIENSSIPTAKAGDTLKMPLTITNNSNFTAKNISAKLSIEGTGANPFDVESLNLTQTINSIGAKKSDSVSFNIKVNPFAEEKTYALTVDLKYSNQQNISFTSTETVYVKITNASKGSIITLKNINTQPSTVNAGEKVNLSFVLSNIGDMDAKAIKVTLTGLNKDEFTILNGSGSDYIDKIAGNGEQKVFYNLNTSDAMQSGNYPLGLKIEYNDGKNNKQVDEHTLFINVKGTSKSSNIAIENIIVNPTFVKTNESFLVKFDVHNNGTSRVENIKVSIKPEEGIMPKSQDIRLIDGLEPGKVQSVEFLMLAGDQLKNKNYNMQISLEYDKYTTNQYAGVLIQESSNNNKLTPKIIINNYKFTPNVVKAGEEFSLDMSFLNTSSSKTVRNIKIFLTGIDSSADGKIVFTPVNSSNTFFVDYINPKKTAQTSLTMYTIPDAQPMTYTITANFEYQDDEGTEYKSTELIGIPVIQQSKIDAGEMNMPPEAYVGQPSPISLQYFNKGKTKLTNLMITVDGDFEIQNKQTYIGNFESGSSDSFEAMIIPQKTGILNGKITFTFDDPSGQTQEFSRDISVNAIEMPPMEPPMDMPPGKGEGGNTIMDKTVKNKFFWIGLGSTAIIAFVAFRIWKKKKNGIELDE